MLVVLYRIVHRAPVEAATHRVGLHGLDVRRVLVRVEVRVPAAQNHLPDVVHAVARGLLRALLEGLGELVAENVEATELVEHGDEEGLALGPEVDYAVAGNEGAPCMRGVEVVVETGVERERDWFALDVPYPT